MENKYWLVTTEHLVNRLWFKDDEDFKAGMNFVAILAATLAVKIFAFVLMSNHVHFVLGGNRSAAEAFINKFKKQYSQYFSRKYKTKELLRGNDVDIRELSAEDESLERAVAYIQMNPVAANICLNPEGYPWGTGNLFFNQNSSHKILLSDVSGRTLAKLIHSKTTLPTNYYLDSRGFLTPSSYVPVAEVESLFHTPKRMNYFLHASSKAKLIKEAPSFNDQLLTASIKSLCISLFRINSFSELSDAQKSELLKLVRFRFSADPNQLARVCGMDYVAVCKLLETL